MNFIRIAVAIEVCTLSDRVGRQAAPYQSVLGHVVRSLYECGNGVRIIRHAGRRCGNPNAIDVLCGAPTGRVLGTKILWLQRLRID